MPTRKIKLSAFNAADYLESPEALAAYLSDAFATNDARQISQALGTAARSKGMSAVAKDTRLGRESLYKALSAEGNPSFDTMLKVISALGLKLVAEAA